MHEPISPELALIDSDLAARARAALPETLAGPHRRRRAAAPPAREAAPPSDTPVEGHRPYPLWARVTAALWLLVLGILIGGAAVPHAQDKPRIVPPAENVPGAICERPSRPSTPAVPAPGSPLNPGT
jgi:hypothetical protein